jgi:hypothetical protein
VERKGVEPSTFALRTRQPIDASEYSKELVTIPESACTSACTSESQNAHETVSAELNGEKLDADLAAVVEAWPLLRKAAKTAILAILHKGRNSETPCDANNWQGPPHALGSLTQPTVAPVNRYPVNPSTQTPHFHCQTVLNQRNLHRLVMADSLNVVQVGGTLCVG